MGCDGTTPQLTADGKLPRLSSRLDASGLFFALCPRPESKEQKCQSKFWLFPYDETKLSIFLCFERFVWNTDLLASGLSLASPRPQQPTLESSHVDVTGCRRTKHWASIHLRHHNVIVVFAIESSKWFHPLYICLKEFMSANLTWTNAKHM